MVKFKIKKKNGTTIYKEVDPKNTVLIDKLKGLGWKEDVVKVSKKSKKTKGGK
tara:strand:- start:4905 stop:5063 length:159 start_codon:yes stop_codon:yes gene_type:complete